MIQYTYCYYLHKFQISTLVDSSQEEIHTIQRWIIQQQGVVDGCREVYLDESWSGHLSVNTRIATSTITRGLECYNQIANTYARRSRGNRVHDLAGRTSPWNVYVIAHKTGTKKAWNNDVLSCSQTKTAIHAFTNTYTYACVQTRGGGHTRSKVYLF